jgi:hypothetical protein
MSEKDFFEYLNNVLIIVNLFLLGVIYGRIYDLEEKEKNYE